ncbi:hypothetical protein SCLCIDRAFT_1209980 [Scleroderma citrinum Foug A]|uniref:Uncharacterized protein n=1 Tax=Scleroderma citrinum Foug A TaxID=1036808 RepID=A0A0C3ASC9_9AGAM|nr:hypothetical protein SCLCIDRAFT_1209980 [Scleroderma citrinum Foug A]
MSLKLSPNATRAILTLLPKELPPSLQSKSGNLCQVLSRYPRDGVGKVVHQSRWSQKGIHGCYWQVTRTQLKLEGKHGKAWGRLVWKGKLVSPREELIPGSLKYNWMSGCS